MNTAAHTRTVEPFLQDENANLFLIEEFKILRLEIEERSKEQRAMERNVVIATTTIISFFVLNVTVDKREAGSLMTVGWLIPPFIAFLALSRWLESLQMIRTLASYISSYEKLMLPGRGGWESNLSNIRSRGKMVFVSKANAKFWGLMTGVPAGLAARHTVAGAASGGMGWIAAIAACLIAWIASREMIKRAHLDNLQILP